jgi:hypothetical protein
VWLDARDATGADRMDVVGEEGDAHLWDDEDFRDTRMSRVGAEFQPRHRGEHFAA